jgi:flagellin
LEEFGNILKRVRVLSVQAANDTQDATSRGYISQEVVALLAEANDIATTTKFNGVTLLNGAGGTAGVFVFHTGAYTTETQSVTIPSAQTVILVSASAVDTRTNAELTIAAMDVSIGRVDGARATMGAAQNKLESTIRNISVTEVNIAAAESNIRDVDFAAESANFAKHNILAQSGSYAMSQANAVQQNVLRLLQ